jgi:hypothetical protein
MPSPNGESQDPRAPLELSDVLYIQTNDGASLPFEVVGVLEDPHDGASYAVLLAKNGDEEESEFIVTDLQGNLIRDEGIAREVVDDFLAFATETEGERASGNGETS